MTTISFLPSSEGITLEVGGQWGEASVADVSAVVHSMRDCCLERVVATTTLPRRIVVWGIPGRPNPVCVATDAGPETAFLILTVSGRRWSQLAYQFGHELGHVVANNWGPKAANRPPSHWLEEVVVEAFSLYGMLKIADRWLTDPPYPHWSEYSSCLKDYALSTISEHAKVPTSQIFEKDPSAWFRSHNDELESIIRLEPVLVGPLVAKLVEAFCDDPSLISDVAALNLWPEGSTLKLSPYLDAWENSCPQTGQGVRLPSYIRDLLGVT